MKNSSFKPLLLRLALIPIGVVIALISALVGAFHWHQIGSQFTATGSRLSAQYAAMLATVWQDHNQVFLKQHLRTFLDEESVESVTIFNLDRGVVLQVGTPLTSADLIGSAALDVDAATAAKPFSLKSAQRNSTVFFYPFITSDDSDRTTITFATESNSNATTLGWVAVELDHAPYDVDKFQILSVILGIGFVSFCLSFVWIGYLNRGLNLPLDKLVQAINKLNEDEPNVDIDIDTDSPLAPLATALTQHAQSLRNLKNGLQTSVDQTTQDLRETLDTIEKQNIELNIARKEALAADRAKTEFLANTSHEIRTPINGIIGFAGLLQNTTLNEKQREYLNTIVHSSSGLLTYINNLIDFSKLEMGQIALDHSPLDLRKIAEEALMSLVPLAAKRQLQLVPIVTLSTNLEFLGDTQRLKQIISNLILHFIHCAEECTIVLRISDSDATISERTQIRLSVNLISERITETCRQQLQSLFVKTPIKSPKKLNESTSRSAYRADSEYFNRESNKVLDLPLTLTRHLVQLMDGELSYDSDRHTLSLWCNLHLKRNSAATEMAAASLSNTRDILVFEKDPHVREQLLVYLSSWKIHTVSITNENALIKRFQRAQESNEAINTIIWGLGQTQSSAEWLHDNVVFAELRKRFRGNLLFLSYHDAEKLSEISQLYLADGLKITLLSKPITHNLLYSTLAQQLENTDSKTVNTVTTSKIKPEPNNQPIRILAVDDNPANLQLLRELLLGLGVEVTVTKDGSEALQAYQQQHFDLVFMDVQMPVMDGIETTKRIRALEAESPRVPIIALTAHAMSEKKTQLLVAGMDDYLTKPVSEDQLRHCIKRWVPKKILPNNTGKNFRASIAPININVKDNSQTQTPSSQKSDSPVDIQKSLHLSNGRADLASELLTKLIVGLPQDIAAMQSAYQTSDFARLSEVVHKLYGGTCYCGVPELHAHSKKVDKILQQKSFADMDAPLTDLLNASKRLLNWSEDFDIPALFGLEQA